ncbi:RNA polymerase sigma factor [Mycobacterium sp. AZCC_0083]|uniref:RNA polymerase sigma factor n=1 Tax=Mycobacterium sp. AZCC_0083 TaxID=2735882 RepID=UPI00160BA241|nr:sigma-70 family RNA polymerase sigma factor [Mycobacterium sp. AZCC_0083]MBB5163718.1 RNA polymerase sigma factor (sigma-70 family) [Mycobacterium sp. AZCC_0083]
MTNALTDWDIVSDAELACAAAAGDRGAFAEIYDRYADRLHDFCIGMVRDRDAAADCVQDVFCTAATQLARLREPDKLRPWLYAIARNEALRHLRARRREQLLEEVPEMASTEAGPDTLAARTELADLIDQAAGGLGDRDRAVLELAYRHGLDGPELADALEVSPGTANRMVSRLRHTIEHSLGALLVARQARTDPTGCPELGAILAGWDGRFSVLMRKRVVRHIESCPICDQERRKLVNPVALLGAAPVFIPAPTWLRERTLTKIRLTSPVTGAPSGSTEPGGSTARPGQSRFAAARGDVGDNRGHRTRPLIALVGILAGTVLAILGLTVAWLHHPNAHVAPVDVSATAPAPPADTTAPLVVAPAIKPPAPPTPGTAETVNSIVVLVPTSGVVLPSIPRTTNPIETTQPTPIGPPVSVPITTTKPATTPPTTSRVPLIPTPTTSSTHRSHHSGGGTGGTGGTGLGGCCSTHG